MTTIWFWKRKHRDYPGWTPYDGQLRLQAYSHLASGALGVMYWHWHSIHNSFETYWKGLLSHDMEENAVYREACIVGDEFKKLSPVLSGLKKDNKVAIMVSNEALTALKLVWNRSNCSRKQWNWIQRCCSPDLRCTL